MRIALNCMDKDAGNVLSTVTQMRGAAGYMDRTTTRAHRVLALQ